MKLVAQNGSCPASAAKLANHYANSSSLEVSQRCQEFKALLRASAAMADALPVDASCEDVDVDPNLPMLTAYVQRALANGAAPYSPPKHAAMDADRDEDSAAPAQSRLNYRPYERAAPPPNPVNIIAAVAPTPVGPASLVPPATAPGASADPHVPTLLIAKNVNQVWGRKPEPPPPAPAAPMPSAQPTAPTYATPAPAPQMAPVPIPTPIPTGPREPTEKEKMAAALFGGLGGSGAKGGAPARRSSLSNQPPAAYSAPPQPQPVVAPPPAPVPTQAPAPMNGNLLDMMDMSSPAPVPQLSHAHVQSAPAAMSNLDLLSGLSAPPPVHHAPPVPPAAPAAPSVFDVFDSVLTPSPQTPAPQIGQGIGLGASTVSALRPLSMPTSEFGARWGQTQGEAKQPVPCRLRALPQVRAALESLGLFHVESIVNTNEVL
jgi:AP-4 complex subunit epsilon-1